MDSNPNQITLLIYLIATLITLLTQSTHSPNFFLFRYRHVPSETAASGSPAARSSPSFRSLRSGSGGWRSKNSFLFIPSFLP